MTADTLGSRLRAAREAAGLSVGQAARAMEYPPAVVADHERHVEASRSSVTLMRYAALYGVSVRHLRDGTSPATDADGRATFGAEQWDALSPQGRADALRCLDAARAAE